MTAPRPDGAEVRAGLYTGFNGRWYRVTWGVDPVTRPDGAWFVDPWSVRLGRVRKQEMSMVFPRGALSRLMTWRRPLPVQP